MSVKKNLLKIKSELAEGIHLIAVSKTKPGTLILEAYETGQRDFGENYVQELVDKYEQLPKDIRWHFIGHLQSNKVKYIVPFVHLIHGVDTLKLLQEINKQATKSKRVVDCLLQLFIAKEETKFGLSFEECDDLIKSETFSQLKNIRIKGLMAMASNTSDEAQIKNEFANLKKYFDKLVELSKNQNTENFQPLILSCGMSSDYQIAVKEGSNMLRIGSTIFGERA